MYVYVFAYMCVYNKIRNKNVGELKEMELTEKYIYFHAF